MFYSSVHFSTYSFHLFISFNHSLCFSVLVYSASSLYPSTSCCTHMFLSPLLQNSIYSIFQLCDHFPTQSFFHSLTLFLSFSLFCIVFVPLYFMLYSFVPFSINFSIIYTFLHTLIPSFILSLSHSLTLSLYFHSFTLFRIILGDFDFEQLEAANRILGPLYFMLYSFLPLFFHSLSLFSQFYSVPDNPR